MGRRGPPAKPSHLKVVEGTYRPDRAATNEPKPPRGIPDRPERLSDRAVAAWDRIGPELERMGVLTISDGLALELLCDAYAEFADARDQVAAEGVTYKSHTENGFIIRAHPAVAVASDAWRRVHRMALEFGLTPASRTRVGATPKGDKPEDPWAELAKS